MEEFNLLRGRVDKVENGTSQLRKIVGELEKRIKNMKTGGGGAD